MAFLGFELQCIEEAEEQRKECAQYRDDGYNKCNAWDSNCCDWWPCSWGCKLITWLCIGWYWVSNLVCVAWTWVTEVVCVAWEIVSTVANAVVETVESIVGWVVSAVGFIVELIFSIPILGRILKWAWNIVLTAFWGFVGLADAVLGFFGFLPEKKLRICVVVLRDEKGTALAQPADIVPHLQDAIDIYREEANVRLIPSGPFQYDSAFASGETADTSWVHVNGNSSSSDILDVSCGGGAAGEDLWVSGSKFEYLASTKCFYSNTRRILGYGAPVIIFIVRSVAGKLGCSIGPLSDYVTIQGSNPICIAHELGHACNLWHIGDNTNLMFQNCVDGKS